MPTVGQMCRLSLPWRTEDLGVRPGAYLVLPVGDLTVQAGLASAPHGRGGFALVQALAEREQLFKYGLGIFSSCGIITIYARGTDAENSLAT